MIESERDHDTIVEVLAAFIREQTMSPSAPRSVWDPEHDHEGIDDKQGEDEVLVATDVQAALMVIGRRPRRPERNPVNLAQADLCGVDLSGLNLDRAILYVTKLKAAIMVGTQLNHADLRRRHDEAAHARLMHWMHGIEPTDHIQRDGPG